jgi:hypothetical protein
MIQHVADLVTIAYQGHGVHYLVHLVPSPDHPSAPTRHHSLLAVAVGTGPMYSRPKSDGAVSVSVHSASNTLLPRHRSSCAGTPCSGSHSFELC